MPKYDRKNLPAGIPEYCEKLRRIQKPVSYTHLDSDMNSFKSMVYEVNHMVLDSSEFLSDNVYIFSRQTKKLMIA